MLQTSLMVQTGDDTTNGHQDDDILIGGAGSDSLDGGGSFRDTADYRFTTGGVFYEFDMSLLKATGYVGVDTIVEEDTWVSIEKVIGSANDYIFIGSESETIADNFDGYLGNDTFIASREYYRWR